jgi:hypothetical protein
VFAADVTLDAVGRDLTDAELLFGEDAGRALVSCAPGNVDAALALASEFGVPAVTLGRVGAAEGDLLIRREADRWAWPARRLRAIWLEAIPRRMAATGGT